MRLNAIDAKTPTAGCAFRRSTVAPTKSYGCSGLGWLPKAPWELHPDEVTWFLQNSPDLSNVLERAQLALDHKQYAVASECSRYVLRRDLENSEALEVLGEANFALGNLTWGWNNGGKLNRGRKRVFAEAVPLNAHNWRKLGDSLDQWTCRLKALFTSADPKYDCAGFICRAYGTRDFELSATGTEPDFPVWSAYLETQPDTLLVVHEAMETVNGEGLADLACIKKALLAMEPSLGKDTLEDWMSQSPLQLSEFLRISRPIQFVKAPTGWEGYQGTMRQLLGRHPTATGLLFVSRVAFGKSRFSLWREAKVLQTLTRPRQLPSASRSPKDGLSVIWRLIWKHSTRNPRSLSESWSCCLPRTFYRSSFPLVDPLALFCTDLSPSSRPSEPGQFPFLNRTPYFSRMSRISARSQWARL